MLRNEVAKYLGMNIETLRFYEKEKLISQPARLENGYRSYSKEAVSEIKFIKHCRSLGLSLEEIKILKGIQGNSVDCSLANEIINTNLKLIEEKISNLKSLKSQLKILADLCVETGAAKDCGIVKSLSDAAKGDSCVCQPPVKKRRKKN